MRRYLFPSILALFTILSPSLLHAQANLENPAPAPFRAASASSRGGNARVAT